jgi:hypothetical protein
MVAGAMLAPCGVGLGLRVDQHVAGPLSAFAEAEALWSWKWRLSDWRTICGVQFNW